MTTSVEPSRRPGLLLIGGLDSSGGAGITRDTAVAARFGIVPRVVLTAVTAQTDARITDIRPVPPDNVAAQMRAASVDPIGAVKIGMLGSGGTVRSILASLPTAPLILDPVLAASSGRALIDQDGLGGLLADLLPRTTLLTPNLPELDALAERLGVPVDASEDRKVAVCLERGCRTVLVKGGHSGEPHRSTDRLYRRRGAPVAFSARRYSFHLRGTGCHLASAIAAGLCQDLELIAAIHRAKRDLARRFRDTERARGQDRPVDAAGMESPL